MPQSSPSQKLVNIKEVRDGIIRLKDGGLRAVLMTSSVNLALKSVDEQEATIMQFQEFLNTLDFSVQIVVQSRKMDLQPYVSTLEERLKDISGDLLKVQTSEYIEFIKWFGTQVDIMNKAFFVVVPYGGGMIIDTSGGGLRSLLPVGGGKTEEAAEGEDERFEQKRTQLDQRIATVQGGITRLGLRVRQLDTEQVIELFHELYNPGDAKRSETENTNQ
jgi:hypothetical protein